MNEYYMAKLPKSPLVKLNDFTIQCVFWVGFSLGILITLGVTYLFHW